MGTTAAFGGSPVHRAWPATRPDSACAAARAAALRPDAKARAQAAATVVALRLAVGTVSVAAGGSAQFDRPGPFIARDAPPSPGPVRGVHVARDGRAASRGRRASAEPPKSRARHAARGGRGAVGGRARRRARAADAGAQLALAQCAQRPGLRETARRARAERPTWRAHHLRRGTQVLFPKRHFRAPDRTP